MVLALVSVIRVLSLLMRSQSNVFGFLSGGEDTEVREREEIRHERRKDRQHDRNISRAAPDKRYMHFLHTCPESFMGW